MGDDGSGSDSVQCITDLGTCCTSTQGPIHRGDWYFPDGNRLPFPGGGDIFEFRVSQGVDLRHRNNANSPTGIYRCDIPTNAVHDDTDISVRDTVYVGLYTANGGMRMRRVTYLALFVELTSQGCTVLASTMKFMCDCTN